MKHDYEKVWGPWRNDGGDELGLGKRGAHYILFYWDSGVNFGGINYGLEKLETTLRAGAWTEAGGRFVRQLLQDESNQSSAQAQNNDGRDFCYKCGAPTRQCGSLGFGPQYDWRICTKCGA